MNSLGIYFGSRAVSIVESKGKKLVNNISIPQSTVSPGELEEKVPAEIKLVEMIALYKDALRRNRIGANEATLCLSGKDLIIRTFELPSLPREEIHGAVNFEAKKYIPFKVEDLITAFQIKYEKASHINQVLFVGIKKDTLDKYYSILGQLNLKVNAIEYSGFSLLRTLPLAGASDKGVVAVLCADFREEDEVNFMVLEDGFPLFSRDINLIGGPDELAHAGEVGPQDALDKLKSEIRVSLDYFQRKFPAKKIHKVYVVSNPEYRLELETYITETGLSSRFIDTAKVTGKPVAYSSGFVKAYAASLSKVIGSKLKLNLLAIKEKALREKSAHAEAAPLLEGFKLDFRMVMAGLLICAAVYGFGIYRILPIQKEVENIKGQRVSVSNVDPDLPYEELQTMSEGYRQKMEALDNLVKKQLYLTEPLDIVPRLVPKEAWLTRMNLVKQEEDKTEFTLEGAVYMADSAKEFEVVEKILNGLKSDATFNKYFKDINIVSIERRQTDRITATNFLISCKTYREKK